MERAPIEPRAARRARSTPCTRSRQDRLCIRKKHLSGVGQCHTTVRSRQELHTELLLQISNLLTERRLLDVYALGRTAEVQRIGYSDEVSEVAQLHG